MARSRARARKRRARERTREYADSDEPVIMRRYDKSLVWLADKLDSLTREHDQAVQDAERYRYVRAAVAANKTFPISPDEYDVMIDAARSPTPE